MDANEFCRLHTEYLIDKEVKHETRPNYNIYADRLGSIDTEEEPSTENMGHVCLNCGKPTKNRRNYCHKVCAAEYKKRDAEIAKCAWCGGDFPKWPVNKITCGPKCSQMHNKHKDIERYKKMKKGLI